MDGASLKEVPVPKKMPEAKGLKNSSSFAISLGGDSALFMTPDLDACRCMELMYRREPHARRMKRRLRHFSKGCFRSWRGFTVGVYTQR